MKQLYKNNENRVKIYNLFRLQIENFSTMAHNCKRKQSFVVIPCILHKKRQWRPEM